jgi:hypothetical protein
MIGFERLGSWTMVMALTVLFSPPATSAAQSVECEKFAQAVDASTQKSDPIEESLWQDPGAVTCFATELEKLGSSVGLFDVATAGKMFRVTDALRKIMTQIYSQDVLLSEQQIPVELKKFVEDFRRVADKNLAVVSALSFGMRDPDPDLRLNSVLIASKTIDDNTVCVPLIVLNDTNLAKTDLGIRGRSNLLGVVTVVAPWVTKQNFEVMSTTRDKIASTVSGDNPNLAVTYAILDNIKKRLDSQAPESAKNFPMDQSQLKLCEDYLDKANKAKLPLDLSNLKY